MAESPSGASDIITLEEVAQLIKYSLQYLNNNYMKLFCDRGVRILRLKPGARPRFYRSDILKLMETQK